MLRASTGASLSSKTDTLAKAFSRLGWIGFWVQVVLGAIPIILMIYAFVFTTAPSTRSAPSLIGHLTIASLLVLAFTTLWSYRYTRLAKRIADPIHRPSLSTVQRAVWTGVAAGALGIALSMLVMLAESILLLLYFLRAPQAGVPVIQPAGSGHATWVSALDIMSLLSLIVIAFGEFVVLTILWRNAHLPIRLC
jgi:Protein of unknown function (DUF3611)